MTSGNGVLAKDNIIRALLALVMILISAGVGTLYAQLKDHARREGHAGAKESIAQLREQSRALEKNQDEIKRAIERNAESIDDVKDLLIERLPAVRR